MTIIVLSGICFHVNTALGVEHPPTVLAQLYPFNGTPSSHGSKLSYVFSLPEHKGNLTVTPGSTITRRCFDPVMSVSKVETHLHFVSWRRVLRSLVAPIRDFSAIVYDNLRSYWLLRLRSIFSTFLMRIAPPSQNGSFLFQGDWQNLQFTTIIFFRSGLGSNVLTCRISQVTTNHYLCIYCIFVYCHVLL